MKFKVGDTIIRVKEDLINFKREDGRKCPSQDIGNTVTITKIEFSTLFKVNYYYFKRNEHEGFFPEYMIDPYYEIKGVIYES